MILKKKIKYFIDSYEYTTEEVIDYLTFYNKCIDNMSFMPDFAHLCITISTSLASLFGYGNAVDNIFELSYPDIVKEMGGGNRVREAMAGWLGDATLYEHNKPDEDGIRKTSFGYDDYWSDVDAIELSSLLNIYSYDIKRAFITYYQLKPYSYEAIQPVRRAVFLNHLTLEKAVTCIAYATFTYANDIDGVIQNLLNAGHYPDTVAFIRRLQGVKSDGFYHGGDHSVRYQER